jgi:hypothetical protein
MASAVRGADEAKRPADTLLRLVPPDVAVVVTAEGLRDQARAFTASHLAQKLQQLPAVKAWLASERFTQFERSRAQIEAFLGSSLAEIRDEVLGDSVVLALRLPADAIAEPSQAAGLLLVRARDQALLKRIVRVINTVQQESGELARIGDIERNGMTYHLREFPAGANRQPEWYVTFPDGTFALSNSESLILAVMDRKRETNAAPGGNRRATSDRAPGDQGAASEGGLDRLPRFQSVERRLAEHAVVRVFVDPRPVTRLIAASARPRNPAEGKMLAMLEHYLAAVDYAGAELVWDEGSLKLHTVETLDPSKLDRWIIHWASDTRSFDPTLGQLPPTAVAQIALHFDATALSDAIRALIPDADQPRVANFETVLTGLLLGQDIKERILPGLGPGAIAYLDAPDDLLDEIARPSLKQPRASPLPVVLVIGMKDVMVESPPTGERRQASAAAESHGATVADALDNALRTLLALSALDRDRAQGRAKITTRNVAGVPIHSLDVSVGFAYAIDRTRGRVIVSTSTDGIARYLEHAADSGAGARFRQFRVDGISNAQTFGCIDLEAVNRLASRHRDRLVELLATRQGRPSADVDRDLAQVEALARLIDAVFFTSRIDPEARAVERSIGVIFYPPPAEPAPKP